MTEVQEINVDEVIKSLDEVGYYIVRGMYSKEFCDNVIEQMKAVPYDIGDGGDKRCPNFERYSEDGRSFMNNSIFTDICNSYCESPITEVRCQAGIVSTDIGSVDSGGGWHVDNHDKQFKSLLYLNDVDSTGGPFAILEGSRENHRSIPIYPKNPHDTSETRYREEVLRETPEWENLTVLTGKAGDVVLVDTSNIHRGSAIKQGTRFTLTNYFYTP